MTLAYSVVLPAFREDENLRILLPRLKQTLDQLDRGSEVLVVDTHEPLDDTEAVCAAAGVRHLRRGPGNSFGDAVRTGIEHARGERVVFMDADGSHPPEFIPRLLAEEADSDVVIASRYVEGGHTENPRLLIFMSRVVNVCYSLVLNLKCKDVSNSFKLYRADQLRSVALKSENFDIIEELLFKLGRRYPGLRIREVPFSFRRRMFGETKRNLFLFMLSYVFTIVRLRLSA